MLSDKQKDLVRYLVESDLPLKQIAYKLNIAYTTTKHYSHIIYRQYSAKNRADLIIKWYSTNEINILEPDPAEELTLA